MIGIETGAFGVVALLILVVAALVVLLYLIPVRLWVAAFASGAYVGLFTLVGMRLRRVPPGTIVTARISAVKAGLDISVNDLEAHYLAGGNVVNVVNALISADKANIADALQAGRGHRPGRARRAGGGEDVGDPQGDRDAPHRRRGEGRHPAHRRLARDRAHQHRPAGGRRRRGDHHRARRRGHGQHHRLGGQPTRTCWRTPITSPSTCSPRGWTPGRPTRSCRSTSPTSTWARTSAPSCRSTRPTPTSRSPRPRPRSGAPWRWRTSRRMRARVVEAEAEVPRAMAEAFRQGNLGIMDYYRMKNVQADTTMREAIAAPGEAVTVTAPREEVAAGGHRCGRGRRDSFSCWRCSCSCPCSISYSRSGGVGGGKAPGRASSSPSRRRPPLRKPDHAPSRPPRSA